MGTVIAAAAISTPAGLYMCSVVVRQQEPPFVIFLCLGDADSVPQGVRESACDAAGERFRKRDWKQTWSVKVGKQRAPSRLV